MNSTVEERITSSNRLQLALIAAGWRFVQRAPKGYESRYALRQWVGRKHDVEDIQRWSLQAVLMLCAAHEVDQQDQIKTFSQALAEIPH